MQSKWSLVTTVKAPDDLIERFIQHYLDMGASKMYIFLDSPNEQLIHKKINDERISFFFCDPEFWEKRQHFHSLRYKKGERSDFVEYRQYHNLLHASSICETEWLLNVDIDELLFSMIDINEELSRIPDNIFTVLIRPLEAVYLKEEPASLINTFDTKYFKSRRKVDYDFWNDIYPDKGLKHKSGFFGHVTGKSFIRTSDEIFRPSCHLPLPMNEFFSHGFIIHSMYILHFEAMTRDLFVQKMVNRAGKVYNTPFLDEASKIRTKYLTDLYAEIGEESLHNAYLDMHVFDDEKMSKCLETGFVVKIDEKEHKSKRIINAHGDVMAYSVIDGIVKAVDESAIDDVYIIPIMLHEKYDNSECYIYFLENGNSHFICSDRDGTPRKSKGRHAQIFRLIKDKNGIISIRFEFKNDDKKEPQFLTANRSGSVSFSRPTIKDWEKFKVV